MTREQRGRRRPRGRRRGVVGGAVDADERREPERRLGDLGDDGRRARGREARGVGPVARAARAREYRRVREVPAQPRRRLEAPRRARVGDDDGPGLRHARGRQHVQIRAVAEDDVAALEDARRDAPRVQVDGDAGRLGRFQVRHDGLAQQPVAADEHGVRVRAVRGFRAQEVAHRGLGEAADPLFQRDVPVAVGVEELEGAVRLARGEPRARDVDAELVELDGARLIRVDAVEERLQVLGRRVARVLFGVPPDDVRQLAEDGC